MSTDLHVHGLAHTGPPHTVEKLWPYVQAAQKQGLKEIGFAEHDEYLYGLDFKVFEELGRLSSIEIKKGLEVNFRPERCDLKNIASRPWDYLIASVHDIGPWGFDSPGGEAFYADWDVDELYSTYFELVARAASTGLFQIIGHLDLIKLYGHRPKKPVVELAEPALKVIAQAGVAVEVNTAGLYKPVGEIYPSVELLQRCFELNIPITISSDAHSPEEVGRSREKAVSLLKKVGYIKLVTFKGRKREIIALE